eukprot:scaffold80953_cov41-Phaeocystis_antarctica.AAC.1
MLAVHSVPVQRQEEEVLAVGEEDEDHLHAGGMRLDHADQGVPLTGLYLLVVEEFVGRMRLCSGCAHRNVPERLNSFTRARFPPLRLSSPPLH